MCSAPLQPIVTVTPFSSETPVRTFATQITIGSDRNVPATVFYNDDKEPYTRGTLIDCYRRRLQHLPSPAIFYAVYEMLTALWEFRRDLRGRVIQASRSVDGVTVTVAVAEAVDPLEHPSEDQEVVWYNSLVLEGVLDSLRQCFIPEDEMFAGFESFVEEYRDVLDWLIEHNTAPHNAPESYHNTRHLIGVAFLTYWLTHNNVPTVLAAFIHDFQYANETPDSVNISYSMIHADENGYFDLDQVKPYAYRDIGDIVKVTEYDFAHPFPDVKDRFHQFLRDADQLYGTVFFDTVVYQGLEAEVGAKINIKGTAFLSRNAQYVANNRFYTDEATVLRDRYLTQCLIRHVQCSDLYVSRRFNHR